MTAKKTNDLRLAAVIADKIEDGTLFHSGIFTRAEIAGKVRNLIAAANQQQADAPDTERLDWLIEQGCHHGVVYEGLDKSFWMVWLDGHDAHKDEHQIGRYHTAREAIDAAIAAAEAAHKQHAQPQAAALDVELLDWLEGEVCNSYTGVTITRIDHREDGMVIERGFRLRRFHKDYEVKPTLRAAIAAAKEKTE